MLYSSNKIYKKTGLAFFIMLIFSIISAKGQQQQITTEGKDFWLAFMDKYDNSDKTTLKVYITSRYNASGTISIPLNGWSQTFSVNANQCIVIVIPSDLGMAHSTEFADKKGIHLNSDKDISIWAMNVVLPAGSLDAAIVLPTSAIGTTPEYIVASYTGFVFYQNIMGVSEFVIVGLEDGSKISMTPSVTTSGGKPAGVPYIITLNKGETYQVKGQNITDLTGTSIKTVSGSCLVFSGSSCTNIPSGCTACDHLYQQCYPIKSWGKEYILTPFMYQAKGYLYRIIASADNTTVTIPGQSSVLLSARQFYTVDVPDASVIYISSDKPISVIQYMKGTGCAGFNDNGYYKRDGDPAMLILNSNNQMLTEGVFESMTTTKIDSLEFINIITKTVNTESIVLDGKNIDKSSFNPVPSLNDYSYAILEIDTGIHTISSDSGFIAYAYGVGFFESYAYSIGMGFRESVITTIEIKASENPVCLGGSVTFTATAKSSCTNPLSYKWYKNDVQLTINNEQLTLNNITENDAGSYYCVVANGCNTATSNTVLLKIKYPPVITFITAPKIKCSRDSVMFKIITNDKLSAVSYQWYKNGSEINDATSNTYIKSVLMPFDAGTYSCVVSSTCGSTAGGTILTMGTGPSLKDTVINITKNEEDSLTIFVYPSGTEPFTYQWLKNDTFILNATNNKFKIYSLILSDSGKYSCMVSNVCGSITSYIITLRVQNDVGISEIQNSRINVHCYPNPVNGVLSIEYRVSGKGLINLKIYDIMGRELVTLRKEENDRGSYTVKYDTQALRSGVYIYKILAGESSAAGKIIIIH
jgi:hypothetical protein